MTWPDSVFATGELVTASQLNRLEMLLASTVVAGSVAASIDFQSIPAHWTHLRVVIEGRQSGAVVNGSVIVRFNGDSGANYNIQQFTFANASASGGPSIGDTKLLACFLPGSSGSAGREGGGSFIVPNYADTAFQKSLRGLSFTGGDNNVANQRVDLFGGSWLSTAEINRITLSPGDGSNFEIGTRASIYGMGRI